MLMRLHRQRSKVHKAQLVRIKPAALDIWSSSTKTFGKLYLRFLTIYCTSQIRGPQQPPHTQLMGSLTVTLVLLWGLYGCLVNQFNIRFISREMTLAAHVSSVNHKLLLGPQEG